MRKAPLRLNRWFSRGCIWWRLAYGCRQGRHVLISLVPLLGDTQMPRLDFMRIDTRSFACSTTLATPILAQGTQSLSLYDLDTFSPAWPVETTHLSLSDCQAHGCSCTLKTRALFCAEFDFLAIHHPKRKRCPASYCYWLS